MLFPLTAEYCAIAVSAIYVPSSATSPALSQRYAEVVPHTGLLYAVTVMVLVAVAVRPRLSVMVTRQVCVPDPVRTPDVWVALVDDVEDEPEDTAVLALFST